MCGVPLVAMSDWATCCCTGGGGAVGVGVTGDQLKKMSLSEPTTADMNTTALMSLETTMARSAS